MSGKWDNKKCPECSSGTLHDGFRDIVVNHRGRTYEDREPGAYCDNCGEGVTYYDEELEQRVEAFRAWAESEESREIAAIRESLALTQLEASKFTGGGHNAFSRYESGEAKPVMAVLYLLRALGKYPQLMDELMTPFEGAPSPKLLEPVYVPASQSLPMPTANCTVVVGRTLQFAVNGHLPTGAAGPPRPFSMLAWSDPVADVNLAGTISSPSPSLVLSSSEVTQ